MLLYPTRIALDGSPTTEAVDDEARALARAQIERYKARRVERKAHEAAEKPAEPPPAPEPERAPEKPAEASPPAERPGPAPQAEERKRDGFAALRQAHRNRIAAVGH